MDEVFQSLPTLHPLAVHFPVAFLSGALLAVLVWSITGGRFWRLTILVMLALGLAGGAFAYRTGLSLTESSTPPGGRSDLLATHEWSGGLSLALTGAALIVLVALNFYLERRTTIRRHPPDPGWMRFVVGLLVLAAWVATALAGYSGHLAAP